MPQKGTGVPRPYSSTDIPTPRRVLEEIFAPVKLWVVTLLLILLSSVSVIAYTMFSSFSYNTVPILVSIGISTVSLLIHAEEPDQSDVRSVPSIGSVTKTTDYLRLSARIMVLSLLAGMASILILVGAHMFDVLINPITRLSVVISLALGFGFSYILIRTLCSYSATHNDSILTLPVDISSLPEIATVLGFVIPPLLILYTSFNDQTVIFTLPFEVTPVDALALCLSIYILYFTVVSRL